MCVDGWVGVKTLVQVARAECERQQVGSSRVTSLLMTVQFVRGLSPTHLDSNPIFLMRLAAMVEPDNNGQFRRTPVTFANCGSSCSPDRVQGAMDRLLSMFPQTLTEEIVDEWIRDFLWIHPFTDGNGRLAWLLRTWLLNLFEDPVPLPDYEW